MYSQEQLQLAIDALDRSWLNTEDRDRCKRFIQEFWKDIDNTIKPERLNVTEWQPVVRGGDGYVRLSIIACNDRDGYYAFTSDTIFFHPKDLDCDTIERLSSILNLPRRTIVERLHKAGLLKGDLSAWLTVT
jgi:hypothetical protein